MTWISKVAAGAMVVCAFLLFSGVIPEAVVLSVLLATGYLVRRELGGFWRGLVGGFVGGVVAGVLILGPGFRLAMRAVALMDPIHPEEFTLGGTFFIVIGIGGILGGISASVVNVLRRTLGIGSPVWAGVLLALTFMVNLVFFSGDISREIFELGISPWINVPLFGLNTLGYGIAAMAIADRAEAVMFGSRAVTGARRVPA
ncbi:MAG TPA: hypothetical protein VFS66_14750 [Acidimicrobiia bacterium]|nr:hypothetical protein [Acidimicrobiia bacterium]